MGYLKVYLSTMKAMINLKTKCFVALRISFVLAFLASIGLIVYGLNKKDNIKKAKTPKEKKSAEETYKTLMYSGLGLLGYSIMGFLILCAYITSYVDFNLEDPYYHLINYTIRDLKCAGDK
jgi:hypothetical protein